MRNVKSKVRKLLDGIIEDQSAVNYFTEMVRYCIKNNIHEFDIFVQRDLYPVVAKKYNKTAGSVETELINILKSEWKNMDIKLYKERFGYDKKPTVKKLLILLLMHIRK